MQRRVSIVFWVGLIKLRVSNKSNIDHIKNIKDICNIKFYELTSIANAHFENFGTTNSIYAHQMDSLKRIRQDSN